MASPQETLKFALVMVILLSQQHVYTALGRQMLERHAPVIPSGTSSKPKPPPTYGDAFRPRMVEPGRQMLERYATVIPRGTSSKPKPQPTYGFSFNRYKKIESDAFRPTSPGHSPGMGHDTPPGRAL